MAQENEDTGQPGWQIRNCYRKPTSLRYLYVISRYFASILKPASNSRHSYPFSLSKPTCLLLLLLRLRLRSSSSPSPKRCIDRTRYDPLLRRAFRSKCTRSNWWKEKPPALRAHYRTAAAAGAGPLRKDLPWNIFPCAEPPRSELDARISPKKKRRWCNKLRNSRRRKAQENKPQEKNKKKRAQSTRTYNIILLTCLDRFWCSACLVFGALLRRFLAS